MNIRKWYFTINETGVPLYEEMIKSAVLSAKKNTDLIPYCIYYGEDVALLDWMRGMGVNVIRHKSSIYEAISLADDTDKWNKKTAEGAYLRIDIPILEKDDDFVLYTDCDVIFIKNIVDYGQVPDYFSAAPEFGKNSWGYCNTGVLVMNIKALRESHKEFSDFCKNNLTKIPEMGVGFYDQAAFNIFYKNKWTKLRLEMNWKPYWGYSSEAEIIHFHGPKPSHIKKIMEEDINGIPDIYVDLFGRSEIGMAYSLGRYHEIKEEKKIEGHIDFLEDGRIVGWALHIDKRTNPVKINIFSGDEFLFSVTADLKREDILSKKGVSLGGFNFEVAKKYKNIKMLDDFGFPIELFFNGKKCSYFNLS